MNQFIDKWLKKTLWIWLPFAAFVRLWKELLEHIEKSERKE